MNQSNISLAPLASGIYFLEIRNTQTGDRIMEKIFKR